MDRLEEELELARAEARATLRHAAEIEAQMLATQDAMAALLWSLPGHEATIPDSVFMAIPNLYRVTNERDPATGNLRVWVEAQADTLGPRATRALGAGVLNSAALAIESAERFFQTLGSEGHYPPRVLDRLQRMIGDLDAADDLRKLAAFAQITTDLDVAKLDLA